MYMGIQHLLTVTIRCRTWLDLRVVVKHPSMSLLTSVRLLRMPYSYTSMFYSPFLLFLLDFSDPGPIYLVEIEMRPKDGILISTSICRVVRM